MEAQRIDRWARALGSGSTRRSVLKGMLAGAGGGFLALMAPRTASMVAAQECLATGEACDMDVSCCSGFCGSSGCFEADAICSSPGEVCGFNEAHDHFVECCAGFYCDGTVCNEPQQTCADEGEACGSLGGDGAVECCVGATCKDGVCVADPEPLCLPEGNACHGSQVECCGDLHCNGAVCVPPQPTCVGEGEACGGLGGDGLTECCGDLVCVDAMCVVADDGPDDGGGDVVTTLPSTGSGEKQSTSPWIVPAALGGAAALLASTQARRARNAKSAGSSTDER